MVEILLHIEYTTTERLRKGKVAIMKRKIVLLITYIMAALFVIVSLTIDSDFPVRWWQVAAEAVSGAWLSMFVLSN